MPKIGVRLPGRVADAGEYLADARALDSAGVDSLWLDAGGDDPWLVLASVAAVSGTARLVVPVSADPGPLHALAARVDTLNRLARGRVVLGIFGVGASEDGAHAVLALARETKCCALVRAETEGHARLAEREADGLVAGGESPERFRAAHELVASSGNGQGASGLFERWARVSMPEDPTRWRQLRRDYDEAGATGIVVPADPRLLDLLRNGDEEDDRSDLQLAQG
jgi:alkanesulfonate monooxygenase SsuD/methylene tetrahydromethanopterin reductase-like flavin-dependent oxidoreductase (luciferase family)